MMLSKDKKKIIVFIPMYNCEKQIPRVIMQFDEEIQNFFDEIIIIDNRSSDRSIEKAKTTLKTQIKKCKTKIFKNKENYNLGGSIKLAFRYAITHNYDYLITLHGDAQGDIKNAIPILREEKYKNADICIGARFHKDSQLEGYSHFRVLGNKIFNLLCSIITFRKIEDLIAGLNVYDVNFIKEIYPVCLSFPNNLTFDVHCLMYLLKNNKRHLYFPLVWKEEDQVSNAKVFKQAFIILKLFIKFVFKKNSLFKALETPIHIKNIEQNYKTELVYKNI